MRKLFIAVAAAGIATTLAPVAHANHTRWLGGCGFDTVNQEATTGQSWVGEANVIIVATDAAGTPNPTASITNVSCEFFINGVSQGTVLTAPNSTGVTANAGRFEFSASDTDTTTICTHATIDGVSETHCANGEVTQVPPQAVVDAINLVVDIVNGLIAPLDPTICLSFRGLAPVVNAANQPGIIWIEDDGSVNIAGARFWDC